MPQYGPFVEVFCETYVHHSVLSIVLAFCGLLFVATIVSLFFFYHRKLVAKCRDLERACEVTYSLLNEYLDRLEDVCSH